MLASRMRMGGKKTKTLYKNGVWVHPLASSAYYTAYGTYFALQSHESHTGDSDHQGQVRLDNVDFTGYKKLIIKSTVAGGSGGQVGVYVGNTGTTYFNLFVGALSSATAEFDISTLGGQLRGLLIFLGTVSTGTIIHNFTEISLSE